MNDFSDIKMLVDNVEKFSISDLYKNSLLNGHMSSKMTFEDNFEIDLDIYAYEIGGFIYLSYPRTNDFEIHSDKVELYTSRCNLGGFRFWLSCPGLEDRPCHKSVGILYRVENHFACRHCHDLSYRSRRSSKNKYYLFDKWFKTAQKIKRLRAKKIRERYANKETKSHKRLNKLFDLYDKYEIIAHKAFPLETTPKSEEIKQSI